MVDLKNINNITWPICDYPTFNNPEIESTIKDKYNNFLLALQLCYEKYGNIFYFNLGKFLEIRSSNKNNELNNVSELYPKIFFLSHEQKNMKTYIFENGCFTINKEYNFTIFKIDDKNITDEVVSWKDTNDAPQIDKNIDYYIKIGVSDTEPTGSSIYIKSDDVFNYKNSSINWIFDNSTRTETQIELKKNKKIMLPILDNIYVSNINEIPECNTNKGGKRKNKTNKKRKKSNKKNVIYKCQKNTI
jgi:hypothetical protein